MVDKKLGIDIGATDSTAPAFARVQKSMRDTQATADRMGASVVRSGGAMRQTIQQAGFQINDFAVQVAAGGSAMTAFVQQGSQMLGMFGAGGAIAGAALAVAGIAYSFFSARDAAKSATDATAQLVDEIKRLNEEAAKIGGGQVGIRSVERLRDLRADLVEQQRALEAIAMPGAGLSDEFGGAATAAADVEAARTQARIDSLGKLIREYDRLILEQDRVAQSDANQKTRGEEAAAALRGKARATDTVTKAQRRSNDEFTALENALDPALAAQRRWADQQALIAAQLDKDLISFERYNELIAQSDAAFRKAIEPQQKFFDANAAARRDTQALDDVTRQLGLTFTSAFEDAIVRGEKLRGVIAGIGQDIARLILRETVTKPAAGFFGKLIEPISAGIAGLFGGSAGQIVYNGPVGPFPFARGGAFHRGAEIVPFAAGGIVGSPTTFPMADGRTGLMGEAGPEAIMPLRRGADGRLGVVAEGSGGVVIHQTIHVQAGVAQTVRAEMLAMLPRFKRETIDAVADARQRGGRFAAAMGA